MTLDAAVSGGLTVTPSFTDGTATKGTDYTGNTVGISFAGNAGESKSFTVATTEDSDEESDETFTVGLSVSGTSVTVTATDTATGTIDDDDTVPAGTPVITNPGDKTYEQGETIDAFDITVSDEYFDTLTVTVTGLPSGLSYAGGQVQGTVAASATAQDYTVTIRAVDEGGLSATATFTITVTAPPPAAALTIADVSAAEGDSMTFTVTLDKAVSGRFYVDPSLTDGTATEGTDYTEYDGESLVFQGNAGESHSFTVTTTEDTTVESDETFTVSLRATGASVLVGGTSDPPTATDTATGTITNDDSATVRLVIPNGGESNPDHQWNGTWRSRVPLTAVLDNAVQGGFRVFVDTAGGTATVDEDYGRNGISFAFTGTAGERHTEENDWLGIIQDDVAEGDETVEVTLTPILDSVPDGVTLVSPAILTIQDDDTSAVTVDDVSAGEGESMTFTVTLGKAVEGGLTVTPSFTDGTATEGTDYDENTAGISFAGTAGETQTFTVATTEDSDDESDETFTVALSVSGTSATVTATGTATGTITDDDVTPPAAVTIDDAAADEGDSIDVHGDARQRPCRAG